MEFIYETNNFKDWGKSEKVKGERLQDVSPFTFYLLPFTLIYKIPILVFCLPHLIYTNNSLTIVCPNIAPSMPPASPWTPCITSGSENLHSSFLSPYLDSCRVQKHKSISADSSWIIATQTSFTLTRSALHGAQSTGTPSPLRVQDRCWWGVTRIPSSGKFQP